MSTSGLRCCSNLSAVTGRVFAWSVGALASLGIAALNADEVPGTVDESFTVKAVQGGKITQLVQQPDGKVLVAGNFTKVNGTDRAWVIRLNTDGSVDESFNFTASPSWEFQITEMVLAVQPDGRILLFNNHSFASLIRLNVDGSSDSSFAPPAMHTSSGPEAHAILLQEDGKILVGGRFSTVNGTARSNLARINADGTLDTTFSLAVGGRVKMLQALENGSVLIGGEITTVGGTSVNKVAKINDSGQLDTSFAPALVPGVTSVNVAVVLEDGRLRLGGSRSGANSDPAGWVAGLLTNGEVDPSFNTWMSTEGIVEALVLRNLESSGYLIGGGFTDDNGTAQSAVQSLDQGGMPQVEAQQVDMVNSRASALLPLADGRVLVGGDVVTVGNQSRLGLARLQANLSLDHDHRLQFTHPRYPDSEDRMATLRLERLADGRVATMGRVDALISADGNTYQPVSPIGVLTAGRQIDEGFSAAPSGRPLTMAEAVASTQDGQLLIGGATDKKSPVATAPVSRFSSAGGWDETFLIQPSSLEWVGGLEVLPDGKVIGGGNANYFVPGLEGAVRRWLPDGQEDPEFAVTPVGKVNQVRRLPDGRILVIESQMIRRLRSNGEVDTGFKPVSFIGGFIEEVKLLPGDRLIAVGSFGAANGVLANRMVKLHADGSVDTSFNTWGGPNHTVHDVVVRKDGDIVIAGTFQMVDGMSCRFLMQLDSSGKRRPDFVTVEDLDGACYALLQDGDQAVLVGGSFQTFDGLAAEGLARVWLKPSGPAPAIPIPPEMQALAVSAYRAMLTWSIVPNAEGYVIERRVVGDTDWIPIHFPTGTMTSFEDDTVTALLAYEYRIRAWNSAGESAPVITDSITMPPNEGMLGTLLPGNELDLWRQGHIQSLARQTDGKILVGGNFSRAHGLLRKNIARLDSNGNLDESFVVEGGPSSEVLCIGVQSDGKIIIGGTFLRIGEVEQRFIARLLPNGTLDPTFAIQPGLDQGPGGSVRSLKVLPDDKIVVGGSFQNWAGDTTRGYVARLNADGSLDNTFDAARPNAPVNAVTVSPDGRVYLAGTFSNIVNRDGTSLRVTRLARLLVTGKVDESLGIIATSYNSTTASLAFHSLDLLPNSEIMAAGGFDMVNGINYAGLVRLQEDGTISPSFPVGIGSSGVVRSVTTLDANRVAIAGTFWSYGGERRDGFAIVSTGNVLQPGVPMLFPTSGEVVMALPDGNCLVGGEFRTAQETRHQSVAKVSTPTGTVDPSFYASFSRGGSVHRMLRLAEGGTLIMGNFSSVGGPDDLGVPHYGMLKLLPDDSIDPAFARGPGFEQTVRAVAETVDGKILVSGNFGRFGLNTIYRLARLHADGSFDDSFAPPTEGSSSLIYSILPEQDGKVTVGGELTSFAGQNRWQLARFSENGALLPDFSNFPSSNPKLTRKLHRDSQGRMLRAGNFNRMGTTLRSYLGRLLSDDTVDADFAPYSNGNVNDLYLDTEGRMTVAGSFTAVGPSQLVSGNLPRPGLARFFVNGEADHSFRTPLNTGSNVTGFAQGGEDNLLAFGTLNGLVSDRSLLVARFFEDGVHDQSFESPTLTSGAIVDAIAGENRVLIGGTFVDVNGEPRIGLAKLRLQPVQPPPDAPSGLTLSGLATGMITLTWGANPASNGYVLEGKQGGSSAWQVLHLGASEVLHYQHSGLAGGDTWSYRLKAFNAIGYSAYSPVLTAMVPGTFAQWLNAWGAASDASPTSDDDGDGITLFEEYARGLSPFSKDSAIGSTLVVEDNRLELTYFRAQPSLVYQVYRSDDLIDWTLIGVDQGGDGPWVTATTAITTTTPRRFLKLVVATAP
ncbi:hypothetical protein FEM03_20540 [Phragmitibacter flavus]|uniref:Fibronectin type-III domain-containing protein n=1 Tax=Phragmitibacter flavus TaxID=2576071 RepID=A0A5R8KAC4_9BACT|nr:hypothetical protein [Phragmitibacter flavus]TLD68865.1 hypothetical protein FEM03_20540 [Phragmitibacter flavus]